MTETHAPLLPSPGGEDIDDIEHMPDSTVPPRKGGPVRRLVGLLFYALGMWFFAELVARSGVTWDLFSRMGIWPCVWIIGLYLLVEMLDVYGWYFAAGREHRPWHLWHLRVAGESLTCSIPGGVVFGESYKAVKLRAWYGTPVAASTPRLLLVKLGLGYSQSLFVLAGLVMSYGLLRDRSVSLIGVPGMHVLGVGAIVFMGLFMAVPAVFLFRGRSFGSLAAWLRRLQSARLDAWVEKNTATFERLDAGFRELSRDGKANAALMFLCLCGRWLASVLETYLLLQVLGLEATWESAFVIESLGSLFRLVFFLVPAGVGGQDASFFALFALYGFSGPKAAIFVVLKRVREIFWIGVGYLLIALGRLTEYRASASQVASR